MGVPECCILLAIVILVPPLFGRLIKDDKTGGPFSSTLMVLFHLGSLLCSLLEFFFISEVAVRDWYLADRKELNLFREELELESNTLLFMLPLNRWFLYRFYTLSIRRGGTLISYLCGSVESTYISSFSSLNLIAIGAKTSIYYYYLTTVFGPF